MSVHLDNASAEVVALRIPPLDWVLIVRAHPNLLVEGPSEETERLIAVLATYSPTPLGDWRQSTEAAADAVLLVRGVDTLTVEQQRSLMDRMKSAAGHPVPRQVISTSETAVFPMIKKGLFLEELYYRLNVVRLEIAHTP